MTDQEKILTAIRQNAEMGTSSIKQIFPAVQNSALKNELRHQLSEYSSQLNTVNRQMSNLKLKGKPISPMAKAMSAVSIKLKSAADNSTGNLAKMLVQGTNMGIIEINKALNNAETASDKLVGQAKDLLSKEQHYLDRLKAYL
ncbi:MAG: hypothetical protein IJ007_08565 [Oscillospiraceae bacterium]|nr:hypothetical protein [Oscillospiraceae bacterium]